MRQGTARQLEEQLRPVTPARGPGSLTPLTAQRRRRAFRRRLASMTASQRVQAAESGRFTRAELALWASLYPHEVPVINGEVEWIALDLADLD